MSKGYEQIKNLVSDASDQMLVDMYNKIIIDEGSDVAEIAVKNAIESELEKRGIITFNEDTFEYDFV